MSHAERSLIKTEYVEKSLLFYQTIQSLMVRYDCNAFTIECFKFCCSRLPDRWQITPCLIHALFRDRGMASACQGDLGVLLAMRMLLSVSGKSCHMGNTYKRGTDSFVVEHASPAIKMNGFDHPGVPYQLGHFVSKGWGTKVIVDFKNNGEKTVTVARVDPAAKKVFVLLGEIVDSHGWCKERARSGVPIRRSYDRLRARLTSSSVGDSTTATTSSGSTATTPSPCSNSANC